MPSPSDPTYDEATVCAAIEREVPELVPVRARHLARGWDHDVFLVNEQWAFRFARHALASAALDVEIPTLAALAPQLPAAVPVIVHSGAIGGGSSFRFAGHRALPGVSLCDAGPAAEPAARAQLAVPLARFIRALHCVPLQPSAAALSAEPLGRLDVARRGPPARRTLAELLAAQQLASHVVHKLLVALDRAEAAPPPADAPCILHADLHPRNLLLHRGQLSGVIDWVDVCVGQPAIDLAAAFVVLPASAQAKFFAAYGGVSDATRSGAHWRAITFMTSALSGALARQDLGFARCCRVALAEMSAT